VREEMTSAPDPSGDVVPDARHALKEEFREIDERLRAMVEMYNEEPSMIDSGATSDAPPRVNVESAIKEAYKFMNARIYAADSPLQKEGEIEIWRAFGGQRDEFIGFYRSALMALENFKDLLSGYNELKARPLNHGDLKARADDGHAFRNERLACIDAVTDFYGIFSAMLTAL
jgi:hypothetical protein